MDHCTSVMYSVTPRLTRWLDFGECAANRCFTQWGGTTTACPPSAGCRTTSVSRAIQRSTLIRISHRHSKGMCPRDIGRWQFLDLTSFNFAMISPSKTKKSSKICSADLDCQSTGLCCTPRSVFNLDAPANRILTTWSWRGILTRSTNFVGR